LGAAAGAVEEHRGGVGGGLLDAGGLRQPGGECGQYQSAEQCDEMAGGEVVAQGCVVDVALE
jgi:hypothetical protein